MTLGIGAHGRTTLHNSYKPQDNGPRCLQKLHTVSPVAFSYATRYSTAYHSTLYICVRLHRFPVAWGRNKAAISQCTGISLGNMRPPLLLFQLLHFKLESHRSMGALFLNPPPLNSHLHLHLFTSSRLFISVIISLSVFPRHHYSTCRYVRMSLSLSLGWISSSLVSYIQWAPAAGSVHL